MPLFAGNNTTLEPRASCGETSSMQTARSEVKRALRARQRGCCNLEKLDVMAADLANGMACD